MGDLIAFSLSPPAYPNLRLETDTRHANQRPCRSHTQDNQIYSPIDWGADILVQAATEPLTLPLGPELTFLRLSPDNCNPDEAERPGPSPSSQRHSHLKDSGNGGSSVHTFTSNHSDNHPSGPRRVGMMPPPDPGGGGGGQFSVPFRAPDPIMAPPPTFSSNYLARYPAPDAQSAMAHPPPHAQGMASSWSAPRGMLSPGAMGGPSSLHQPPPHPQQWQPQIPPQPPHVGKGPPRTRLSSAQPTLPFPSLRHSRPSEELSDLDLEPTSPSPQDPNQAVRAPASTHEASPTPAAPSCDATTRRGAVPSSTRDR